MKRNSGSLLLFSGSLSQQKHKRLMLRVRVAAVKKKDSCNGASVKSTNILSLSLAADEASVVWDDFVSRVITGLTVVHIFSYSHSNTWV